MVVDAELVAAVDSETTVPWSEGRDSGTGTETCFVAVFVVAVFVVADFVATDNFALDPLAAAPVVAAPVVA